jgi:hypothetical protein
LWPKRQKWPIGNWPKQPEWAEIGREKAGICPENRMISNYFVFNIGVLSVELFSYVKSGISFAFTK